MKPDTQQIKQQPALALKIAHQTKILIRTKILQGPRITFFFLPAQEELVRKRQVVMNAGNSLHLAAITHT